MHFHFSEICSFSQALRTSFSKIIACIKFQLQIHSFLFNHRQWSRSIQKKFKEFHCEIIERCPKIWNLWCEQIARTQKLSHYSPKHIQIHFENFLPSAKHITNHLLCCWTTFQKCFSNKTALKRSIILHTYISSGSNARKFNLWEKCENRFEIRLIVHNRCLWKERFWRLAVQCFGSLSAINSALMTLSALGNLRQSWYFWSSHCLDNTVELLRKFHKTKAKASPTANCTKRADFLVKYEIIIAICLSTASTAFSGLQSTIKKALWKARSSCLFSLLCRSQQALFPWLLSWRILMKFFLIVLIDGPTANQIYTNRRN